MPRRSTSRKDRLKTALRHAGLSHGEIATRWDVTYQHLYLVLRGERESPRLDKLIDAFIERHAQEEAAA